MNHRPRSHSRFHLATRLLPLLALGLLSALTASAAPPDLTAPGVIAGIDRSETYNLGPTGLRGWIHITRTDGLTHGSNGTMTGESRQILVTVASAPANAVLAVDDVILGAMAASTGNVPLFSSDARKAFATAITEAEKTGGGTLRVKRWRAGTTTDVNIPIAIMGDYTATAPYSCPKSSTILANARNKLVADLKADANFLWGDWKGSITALALLASVQPGDPDYGTVQTRLQTHARNLAAAGPQPGSLPIWTWAYNGLFLAEYYLATGDANVLPGIQSYTLKLVESQSIYGTYGHGPAFPRPDGSGRRVATGYGPVNAAGIVANMAIFMGKKALVAGSQPVDPEINTAIQRGSDYFKFYVNKGSIPYGEHEPGTNGHTSNGKDPMCAVFFGLQSGHATETEYFARMAIATYNGREYGHTGQGFSYLWNALGANMGGALAVAEHLKPVRWHLDLSRRTDGSFAYDGAEQYGAGSTSGGTYLGASGYYGLNTTASYLLTYSLPLQRLYITGKRDTPANPPALNLDASTVAEAIDAGNFKIDCPTFTTATLISSLNNYDPIVRHYAAIELGNRSATITPAELSTLRTMLTGPDANARMGAAQALGILQDGTALPTIVTLLNDPDIWVRAKAAVAIRAYPSATAGTHRDAMMTSFIANATNPDVIDWSDPLQMGNGKLSMAVFGHGVGDGTPGNDIAAYTINAPKESLLYPALRAGLQQPDSYVRTGATQFAKNRLSLTDTQAVYPSVAHAAAYDTPADRMWSGSCRADAITMLAALKITDAIPLALAMLESAPGFEWGEGGPRIAALNGLASYGDAARYTLPTLKDYLTQWNPSSGEYPVLVSTIETIENATTAPAQSPGLCVANSQVVTTTGSTAITLTGSSPRGSFTYLNVTQPAHGTLTGTAPNLTYTPNGGYTGPDSFTFQTTDTLTTSRVATVGIIVGTAGNGLKGEYFDNANFTNPVLTRTDAQVNFDWGTGSPHASIGADTFSVRWSGVLLVPQTGNYTFSALTSDGVRLYINGQLVIDRFVDQSTRWTDSTPVYLTAGQYAEVYMEYYENTGSAVAKLKWTGPGFAGANGNFIPQAYLFDGSGISNRPAYAFPQSLSTNQNTALPITLNGSGGSLTYTVLTQPVNGTLSGTAPNLTYTPNSNFSGTDSFTFLVQNGTANSLPATVSISVQAGPLTSFTWTNAVSGNWNDGSKWTPGLPAATGQPYYALNFTNAGTYTATHNLNNGFQLNQLNANANVTLAGTQGVAFAANGGDRPQLNQNGSNEVRVDHPMSLQAMTTLGGSGGGKVILNGEISGTGGLIKNSPGDLEIGQNNSYSGGTTINAGTLTMTHTKHSALGSGPLTLNGGTLLALSINAANPITAHGGKLWADGGWGGSWSGPVTLNGNLTVYTRYYDRVSLNGNITGTGGLIAEGDTSTYNSGNGVFLTGTNTYTGKTAVTSGMWLHCSHPAALGSGAVEISGNAKLDLTFTGTRPIASLTLDGVAKTPGTYGSTASNATHKDDTYFSGTGTVTVLEPTATSLNLSSGSSPAASGTSLTFTATVTGSSPSGTVEFFSGPTLLGTSALNGSFQAAFTTNQLAVGPHSITARYVGNSSNSPSNSGAIAVEITSAAPAAPTGLNATPGAPNSSNISLSWTASGGATGYYVKRSTTNGGPYSILTYVTATTFQDTTATPGVSYYYVVSALNAVGESADSTQATATVVYIGVLTDTDPMIVPEGGTATFQVKLSRQPTGSGQGNVTVSVQRTAGDADITVQSGPILNLTFNKTTWNTWQIVTLAAANDADALDGTATITCTPGDITYLTKTVTAIENDTHTTLTITNNGNGSTTPSGSLTVAKGASTNISATPANAEYLFGNWSVTNGSATFGNANATSTTVTLNGPATIRANFTAKPYTVTYYGTGSSGGTPPVDPDSPHPHSSTVTVLGNTGNLAKTGFTFVGWNTASNGSGTTYTPGATFTMPMSNVSLHPVWNQLPTANAGLDQTIYITTNTWSPLILNPGLWLDAADSQTITASAGAISQWADKSGNNRHASQATSSNQPAYVASGLNSKGIVRFDGSDDLFSVDLDFLAGASHSAFIVTKPTVFNNIYGAANGGQGANSLHVGFNGSDYRMNYWSNDFGPSRSANYVAGAANIVNYAWTSGIGKEIFANGKSEGSNTDAGLIGTMSGGGQIGSTTGQGYFGGDIAEILIIPGALTTQDREKIEGYLAHKWGLSDYLASSHPYKSSPPAGTGVSATTTLAGSATDPESNPLTTTWSQMSGPSTAEFANTATLDSTVTFTQEGTYVLQLTADDGSGSATDTVTITVNPPIVHGTPPTPNPMTWASVPAATSSSSITMTATTASAPSGVEYYFDETSGNPGGTDSGWQDSPTYTDTGLNPSTSYTYTVKARDKSASQNETGISSAASATTNPPAVPTVVWNVNIGNEITITDNFAGAAPENTPNSFWNSATTGTIAASASYNLALKDSTNSVTPATLTLTAPANNDVGYADWAAVTGVELFSSWIKTNGNSTPFTMTIGGLTSGATYDLIVYSDWIWKGNDWFPVTQTIGSGLTGTVYLDQISSGSDGAVPNLVQDTDPAQNGAVEGNWIRITGLIPDASGNLAFSMGGRNSAFNGFQLIQIGNITPDTTPPTPNPMTWASVPSATSSESITMTATTASDPSDVEYYFDETSGNPGGTDSGWQDSPTYIDTGLNPSTSYTYTVKARDKSAEQSETEISSAASATTNPPSVPTVVWNVNIGDQVATSDNYAGAVTQANPIQWNSITASSASALALKDSSGSTAGGITLDLTSNKNPGSTSLTSGDKIFLGWFGGAGAQSAITLRGLTVAKTYDILFYSDWYWKNGDSLPITQTAGTGLSGTFYLNRILSGADGSVSALTPDTNPANVTSGTGNTGNYCRIVGIVPDIEGKVSFRIGDGANSAFNGFQLVQTGDTAPRADILDFSLTSNPPSIRNAVISDTDITLTVPYGTDVTNLAPTFTLWPGATCVPVSGTARNFTTPQTYTVTSSDSLVTKNYLVTVVTAPPLPEYTLTAPATWDGRATITAQPAISNLALLQANNGTNFTYTWSTSGLAVTHTTTPGVMSLTRSQGSGVLTITLTLNNGTENVTRSTTINVTEPGTDPWLERTPDANEKADNGQFIARNPFTNNGIIHYNGTQSGTPDSVYLKVFQTPSGGSETLLARHEQVLVNGNYTFAAPVPAGLFTFRVVYGTKTGTTDTDIATVTDLVCGDAYIIEGQSNALAIDNGEPQVDTSSPWIYTYTIAQGWVPAIAKPTSPNWDRKIGFWGMKMAQEIVASHQMPVCIINGAEGGTRIDQHQPNPANRTVGAGTYDIYANLLNRVIAAKLTHGIRGIFWHQGESDGSNSGPPLDPDHLFYEQNFLTMSSAWKQDFPNIQRYILFQVAPNPCSMGPFGSEIREVQRRLPRLFSKMSIVGTIAIPGYEGCHYSKTGYENLAALVLPVVNRDFYDISSPSAVTSPNLVRVWFTNEARTSISLKFDQPMSWNSFSLPNWHLNDVPGQVMSGSASGDTITLQLASAASANSTLDYVKDSWNFSESVTSLIYGVNGMPALTFADVPVTPPTPYEAWAGSAMTNPLTDHTPDGDPDGDDLTNLQEFAFDTDPIGGRSSPIQIDQSGRVTSTGLPDIRNFAAPAAAADFRAVFPRRKDYQAAGLIYRVEFSADLTRWTASNTGLQVLSTQSTGNVDAVSVPFPPSVPVTTGDPQPPKFFRVSVATSP